MTSDIAPASLFSKQSQVVTLCNQIHRGTSPGLTNSIAHLQLKPKQSSVWIDSKKIDKTWKCFKPKTSGGSKSLSIRPWPPDQPVEFILFPSFLLKNWSWVTFTPSPLAIKALRALPHFPYHLLASSKLREREREMKPMEELISYCPKEKRGCIRWVEKYFKDCLCNLNDEISFGLGLVSLVSWGVAEIPQIITNFGNKSGSGVSLAFLFTWIVGYVYIYEQFRKTSPSGVVQCTRASRKVRDSRASNCSEHIYIYLDLST